jgi:diaminohydroxyphosphoribosylaminopyrimidine deaminase / 5-amino-6-(5-phosphoribosylamino)uracil reductase
MRHALELAEAGWGRVHPNPLVGAVVVMDGAVVGQGAHREFGGPHAEVEALRAAGPSARGATLYVTLEPCDHHGKTPPCTDAIRAAGIRRVVYAVADPNPEAGGGAGRLAEAGIQVVRGVEEDAARTRNAHFLYPLERGRPFVALKFGLSLDGRIARAEGERTRVTGQDAEAEVHRLRAGFDAVMVGGRTARTDDPLLTVRGPVIPRVPPVRVVVSATGEVPLDGRLVGTLDQGPVWIVTASTLPAPAQAALEDRGLRVLGIPGDGAGLDPGAVIAALASAGVRTVLCEGGGRLGAALLRARLVQRLYLFHAPVIFGDGGVPAFPGPGPGLRGRVVEARRVGADTYTIVDGSD